MTEGTLDIAGGFDRQDVEALGALLSSIVSGAQPSERAPVSGLVFRSDKMPIMAPALLLSNTETAGMQKVFTPPDGMMALHEFQSFEWQARDYCDGDLTGHSSLEALNSGRSIATTLRAASGPVCTCLTRLKWVTPEDIAGMRPTRASEGQLAAASQVLGTRPITDDIVAKYLRLARDDNPIHRSNDEARQAGLPHAVVPGMLIVGLACAAAEAGSGLVFNLVKARFLAPLAIGETARLALIPRGEDRFRVISVSEDGFVLAIADFTAESD